VAGRAVVGVGKALQPFGVDVLTSAVVLEIDGHANDVFESSAAAVKQGPNMFEREPGL
jgi:hypothetical protein